MNERLGLGGAGLGRRHAAGASGLAFRLETGTSLPSRSK